MKPFQMPNFLAPAPQTGFASVALFTLRLIAGTAFAYHGWGKLQTPLSWMPPQAPLDIPPFLQFLAALAEFGGGVAWIIGLFTPLASVGIAVTMAIAVYFHMVILRNPFVNDTGGLSSESTLGYLGMAVLILAMGPGTVSLDALVFGMRPQIKQLPEEPVMSHGAALWVLYQ
jgi:putative oxidoreductase